MGIETLLLAALGGMLIGLLLTLFGGTFFVGDDESLALLPLVRLKLLALGGLVLVVAACRRCIIISFLPPAMCVLPQPTTG